MFPLHGSEVSAANAQATKRGCFARPAARCSSACRLNTGTDVHMCVPLHGNCISGSNACNAGVHITWTADPGLPRCLGGACLAARCTQQTHDQGDEFPQCCAKEMLPGLRLRLLLGLAPDCLLSFARAGAAVAGLEPALRR